MYGYVKPICHKNLYKYTIRRGDDWNRGVPQHSSSDAILRRILLWNETQKKFFFSSFRHFRLQVLNVNIIFVTLSSSSALFIYSVICDYFAFLISI